MSEAIVLDRDPRVPDVSETWFLPSGGDTSRVASCSAVFRHSETGELFRCPFWSRLTLVRGHWLCRTCVSRDPREIVWPVERSAQLAMWDAVPA